MQISRGRESSSLEEQMAFSKISVISVATTYAGREVVFLGVTSPSGVSFAARSHRVPKCFPSVLQARRAVVALVCAKTRVKLHISRRSSGPSLVFRCHCSGRARFNTRYVILRGAHAEVAYRIWSERMRSCTREQLTRWNAPGSEDQLWSFITVFAECSITFLRNACLALRSLIFFDLCITSPPSPSGLPFNYSIITIKDLVDPSSQSPFLSIIFSNVICNQALRLM